jgi:tRNA pseudouridine55 synthase
MNGVLLVDKPEGITSNGVVGMVKSRVKPAKVGHTGALDPAASGLLVITIGSATRTLDYLDENPKAYLMGVILGEESDTGDREGEIVKRADPSHLTLDRIHEVTAMYNGVIDQIPPHYAAIKQDGTPLYKLARKGIFPDLAPRKIEVYDLRINSWSSPCLELELACSKGTYARSLARDIGNDLGVGGRLETLRRTGAGKFRVEDAISLDQISEKGRDIVESRIISIDAILDHIPEFPLAPPEMKRLARGAAILVSRVRLANAKAKAQKDTPEKIRLFRASSRDGSVVILMRPAPKGSDVEMRPAKVFLDLQENDSGQ